MVVPTRRKITQPVPRLARLAEAAEYGPKFSVKTLRRRIIDGTLTGYRAGEKLLMVDLNEIDRIIRPVPTGGDGDAS